MGSWRLLVHGYSSMFNDWQRQIMATSASEGEGTREGRDVGSGSWTRRGRLSDWCSRMRENDVTDLPQQGYEVLRL